jgi:hypothetical protein
MATWVQEVEVDQIVDGGAYFIAIRPKTAMAGYLFWSRGLNGKERWASKPGIAIRVLGNEKLRNQLRERPTLVAVAVPADADKRWKRRKAI